IRDGRTGCSASASRARRLNGRRCERLRSAEPVAHGGGIGRIPPHGATTSAVRNSRGASMKPVDPRLLRYARAARGFFALSTVIGGLQTAVVVAFAWML